MSGRVFPRTPRDVFKLRPREWLAFNGAIAFFKVTGLWRYPAAASGDLETMTFLDKAYWLYKTENPVRRGPRGRGLEAFFERQKAHRWELPRGFETVASLSVSAVGDLINHEYLANSRGRVYAEVSDLIFGADLPMANLECVILGEGKREFQFSAQAGPSLYYDPESFEAASGHEGRKFAFMATACNHSLDFGPEGVESTIRALRAREIAFNGVNESEADADKATILEKNGIRVGVVAYAFGLNAYRPPEGRPRIVNRAALNSGPDVADLTQFERQIAFCREKNVDFVIAQLHWGMEHEFYPRPEQIELAHRLAEMGIDAVIGHHPHVIQPVEFYRTRRDPARVVPIYYSLGNLINAFSAPYLRRSGVARLKLAKGRLPGGAERTYVENAGMTEVEQVVEEGTRTLRLLFQ